MTDLDNRGGHPQGALASEAQRAGDLSAQVSHIAPPRAVAWRDRSAMLQIWAPRLIILPHIFIGAGLILTMLGALLWMLLGTTVEADVRRAWSTRSPKSTTCRVAWTYVRDGERQEGEDQVSCGKLELLSHPRAVVPVRALRLGGLRYEALWLPVREPIELLLFPWFFGVFWNGVAGVFANMLCVLPARQRALLACGVPTEATVIGKRVQTGKATSYLIDYRYTTMAGSHQGRATARSKPVWDATAEGARLLIFHDPERPERSVAYEHCPYCIPGLQAP